MYVQKTMYNVSFYLHILHICSPRAPKCKNLMNDVFKICHFFPLQQFQQHNPHRPRNMENLSDPVIIWVHVSKSSIDGP